MSGKLRVAVIGTGHFGRYHAAKYAALDTAELVAVVDFDPARAEGLAAELGVRAETDYRRVLHDVEAVSIAVPTEAHFEVASTCLEHGLHVLVEKPIANTLEAADRLIELAERKGRILQIGHIERFSDSYLAIADRVHRPLYIESYRIAPFNARIMDVNVILDLMIHDIDMVMALVKAPVETVDAVGAPVITLHEDIANTRLKFSNGCVANITASRISSKTQRTMRIFEPESYTVVDFQNRKLVTMAKGLEGGVPGPIKGVRQHEVTFDQGDHLAREISAFIDSVQTGAPVVVDGRAGREALDVALRIADNLRAHLDRLNAHGQLDTIR